MNLVNKHTLSKINQAQKQILYALMSYPEEANSQSNSGYDVLLL